MAYYIDETKKTAIKCEGKNAFAWNVETGRFDLPATEVSPKSRMTRRSDFEARRYLFENHPGGYVERLREVSDAVDNLPDHLLLDDLTEETAEARLKMVKDVAEGLANEIRALQAVLLAYGLTMSVEGQIFQNRCDLLANEVELAQGELEIVKLQKEMAKCESGHCEECKWYDSCEQKKPNPDTPVGPVEKGGVGHGQ